MNTEKEIKRKKGYKPKIHDFRAQSRFKSMPDGTVKIINLPGAGYIDPRDTIIMDPF